MAAALTFHRTDRRTLYVDPQSGAETSVFTITGRDRNRLLAEAVEGAAGDRRARLLVNAQSGRAAVQLPAPSLHDDGTIERRAQLLRPMERPAISVAYLTRSHRKEADRADFVRAWEAEIAAVPEFTASSFHIVIGSCCRSGNESRTGRCASADSGPTMASASSAGPVMPTKLIERHWLVPSLTRQPRSHAVPSRRTGAPPRA